MDRRPRDTEDPVKRIVEVAVTIALQHMSAHIATSFAEFKRSFVADFYAQFAGQYIPKNTRLWRIERDERIAAAGRAGRTAADIAQEFHLSEAWINRILESRREPH